MLALDRREAPDERLARLERNLEEYALADPHVVRCLAPLLGLSLPEDRYPPVTLSPQLERRRTLETMVTLVLALAARRPVLLVVEDLQWVDPSTLECLSLLVEHAAAAQLLAVVTARPDFASPWSGWAQVTPLMLNRLSRAQSERLIAAVADGKAVPALVIEQVVTKTDGVPLFVEELTKMVLESGLLREESDRYELAGPLPPLAIPATLQDSLMARLDRLASVKAVVQIGATIGRSFSYAVLQAVSALDDETLERELGKLVDAELLYQREMPPQATYTFRHALIQDAAYQTLLKSTRQQYHLRIAQALAAEASRTDEIEPELVAHHYTEAGLIAQAIPWWQQAGEQSARRSASVEAIGHLDKAVTLLEMLPDDAERARQELVLRLALGRPLVATRGQASRDVERTYARARELCRQLDDTAQICPALFGLFGFHLARVELHVGRSLGEELLALVQTTGDPFALVAARRALGTTLFYLGELESAYEHADAGVAVYRRHHPRTHLYGREVGVACQLYTAMALQLLGYPERADRALAEGRRLAQELSDPFGEVFALAHSAQVHQFRGEPARALEFADAALVLARAQEFPYYATIASALRAWALGKDAKPDDRLAQISWALAERRALGSELARPYYLALLSEVHRDAGDIEEALALLAESSALADSTGERWWLAEQHRLTGELLLLGDAPDEREAERCFRRALDVAGEREAKSLELRAATSLSRLWHRQGRRDDARRVLAEVYGWFTEGLDSPDLRDARAVLDAL
jgi:predicted ATPase